MKRALFLLSGLFLGACVSLDQLPPGAIPAAQTPTAETSYPALDAAHTTVTSSHFTIYGYSASEMESVRNVAEELFTKISSDMGLYTLLASQTYSIVIYRDRDDYLKNTKQPETSSVVMGGDNLYLYYTSEVKAELAHHMTHLLVKAYLGDKRASLKWLDEGLAMMEEVAQMSELERGVYSASKTAQLRQNRMAFSQMTFFITNKEDLRRTDPWYQQVESVISYLLAQSSPLAFAQFLSELRVLEIDRALADAYPAKFRSFSDLEAAWKYTI